MTNEQKEKLDLLMDIDSIRNFKVETLEIAGLHSVLESLHLPFGGGCDSKTDEDHQFEDYTDAVGEEYKFFCTQTKSYVTKKDVKLIHNLIKNGDEHAKAIRGLQVYARITAPRGWWQEMVTYEVGVTKMGSNSTMHQECKGLSTRDLVIAKNEIKEELMQTRTHCFSYQTLRRIYFQRRNHRLPYWWVFCDWIRNLPFAEEWITFEKE